jgi:hypothetical protein
MLLLAGDVCKPSPLHLHNAGVNEDSSWFPFNNQVEFKFADFLFWQNEMLAGDINELVHIWSTSETGEAPFSNHKEMYQKIHSIPYGDIPWSSFSISYVGEHLQTGPLPSWMEEQQIIWYCNPLQVLQKMISNPDFRN